MMNKKLIPFEVIEKAVAGELEAVDAVLRHYTANIKYLPLLMRSQEDKISRLLSPSIYCGDCYAVEGILSLIYAVLWALK